MRTWFPSSWSADTAPPSAVSSAPSFPAKGHDQPYHHHHHHHQIHRHVPPASRHRHPHVADDDTADVRTKPRRVSRPAPGYPEPTHAVPGTAIPPPATTAMVATTKPPPPPPHRRGVLSRWLLGEPQSSTMVTPHLPGVVAAAAGTLPASLAPTSPPQPPARWGVPAALSAAMYRLIMVWIFAAAVSVSLLVLPFSLVVLPMLIATASPLAIVLGASAYATLAASNFLGITRGVLAGVHLVAAGGRIAGRVVRVVRSGARYVWTLGGWRPRLFHASPPAMIQAADDADDADDDEAMIDLAAAASWPRLARHARRRHDHRDPRRPSDATDGTDRHDRVSHRHRHEQTTATSPTSRRHRHSHSHSHDHRHLERRSEHERLRERGHRRHQEDEDEDDEDDTLSAYEGKDRSDLRRRRGHLHHATAAVPSPRHPVPPPASRSHHKTAARVPIGDSTDAESLSNYPAPTAVPGGPRSTASTVPRRAAPPRAKPPMIFRHLVPGYDHDLERCRQLFCDAARAADASHVVLGVRQGRQGPMVHHILSVWVAPAFAAAMEAPSAATPTAAASATALAPHRPSAVIPSDSGAAWALAGFLQYFHPAASPAHVCIDKLLVAPSYQGHGYSRALLRELFRRSGTHTVEVWSLWYAEPFYKRMGFRDAVGRDGRRFVLDWGALLVWRNPSKGTLPQAAATVKATATARQPRGATLAVPPKPPVLTAPASQKPLHGAAPASAPASTSTDDDDDNDSRLRRAMATPALLSGRSSTATPPFRTPHPQATASSDAQATPPTPAMQPPARSVSLHRIHPDRAGAVAVGATANGAPTATAPPYLASDLAVLGLNAIDPEAVDQMASGVSPSPAPFSNGPAPPSPSSMPSLPSAVHGM
ncbi:hypothetical protein CXG81DRAFT_16566 [Caulochytrium protostelioides]|uniref:N-acetyltransferase domain-containing protein n=1 Tax=Caulochytrium protostelioides TaxID=1555241 RepID=A0A4P9XEP3_9FUNG|nr:hypothetical protein CXG81DRAFT_16566 [Caulochytrium protostelioides]|eukprot:RKP03998.1 hypothetical protein CXG81DRAFT_16566 [Caulochytrium protostelioides]